jgi:hypothetical protein
MLLLVVVEGSWGQITHLKVVIKERKRNGGYREQDEDAEGGEGELNFPDLQDGAKEDGYGMTVEHGKKKTIEDVPWHLLGNGLDDAAASQRLVT